MTGERPAPPPKWLGRASTVVLVLTAAACLGVLARALGRAGPGVGLDQLLTFYVAPTVLAVAVLGVLRTGVEARVNGALLITAVGGGALCAEAVLLAAASRQDSGGASPSVYDVVMEHRANGERAFPRVPGNVLVDTGLLLATDLGSFHPLGPAPGKATVVLCAEGPDPIAYRSDRFGFSNADSVWDAARVEVALIGDSYTAGVCVDPDDQIASHLRARWTTLNVGMSGAGPLRELGILREYVSHLAPAVVVWVYYEGNDLPDLAAEQARPWLVDYLDPTYRQDLRAHRDAVDARYAAWLDSIVAGGPSPLSGQTAGSGPRILTEAARLRALRELLHYGVLFPTDAPPLGLLPEVLRRAHADVTAWGGTLLLAYLPSFVTYDVWIGDPRRGREELRAFARAENIPLVDLDVPFRATGDPRDLWSSPRGHLNPTGYRVAADAIARAIDSVQAAEQGSQH